MMDLDNTTPIKSTSFDQDISKTIPFYPEFYTKIIDLVKIRRKKESVLEFFVVIKRACFQYCKS